MSSNCSFARFSPRACSADTLALIANAAGKLTREGLRVTGRGGTALPGLVALTVDPNFITALSSGLRHGVVCVSGTNGKTTTARMLADIARAAGWEPIHNRSGSNLDRGVAAALLADANWYGETRGDVGLFEIDEASLPNVVARLNPRVVVVTNLFRDQMDRYFELDTLAKRIGEALATLPAETIFVLNADDPTPSAEPSRRRSATRPAARAARRRSPTGASSSRMSAIGPAHPAGSRVRRVTSPRRRSFSGRAGPRSRSPARSGACSRRCASRSPGCTTRTTRSPRSAPLARSTLGSPMRPVRSPTSVPRSVASRPSTSKAGRYGSCS